MTRPLDFLKRHPKAFLPFAVVLLGVLIAFVLVKTRPQVETQKHETPPPLVRVLPVTFSDLQLKVRTQGTVTPRSEATLVSQVAGQVMAVSPAFASGGFFDKGEVLLTIDPRDYELAVIRAGVQVAQAELRLAREVEEAEVARQEWERVGQGAPTPLVLRKPQLAEAKATLDAARAMLEQAELNLERTRIRAPYDGRVRAKSADVGQFVSPGAPLARIYAVDYAEVRLPIPDGQLAYLDLSFDFRGEVTPKHGPEVVLSAGFAGRPHTWNGRIVRVEGEIDSRTRMVYVVARVKAPYDQGDDPNRPPLAVGLFVDANILGHRLENVVVLPPSALRAGNRVLVVDAEDRLHFREVDIHRANAESVVLHSGLAPGERVCISPLDAVVDGMRVRAIQDDSALAFAEKGGGE